MKRTTARAATQSTYTPRPRTIAPAVGLVAAAMATAGGPYSVMKRGPRPATPAEEAHMGRVAALGCVLCARLGLEQASRTEVHHLRTGIGKAQRAPHWLTMPLCWECHQGAGGVHGGKARLSLARWTELDLLADTIKRLAP